MLVTARVQVPADPHRGVVGSQAAGDDPGDVGAVAVAVGQRIGDLGDERAVLEPLGEVQVAVLREVPVTDVDPGVQHRPDDPLALRVERALGGPALRGDHGAQQLAGDLEVRPHPLDHAAGRWGRRPTRSAAPRPSAGPAGSRPVARSAISSPVSATVT